MPGQFALPLLPDPDFGAGRFIIAPCNEQAHDFICRWPDWPARSAALYGPAGSGKSHLAHIWRVRADALLLAGHELAAKFAEVQSSLRPVVIEDFDRDPADAVREHLVMELFDHPRRAILLTGRLPPQQWPSATGDWKSRLQSLIACALLPPDDAFLAALTRSLFGARQLQVPHAAAGRIVTLIERTPEAVVRLVAAADMKALAEKRPVSLRLIMELLGGDETGLAAAGRPEEKVQPL